MKSLTMYFYFDYRTIGKSQSEVSRNLCMHTEGYEGSEGPRNVGCTNERVGRGYMWDGSKWRRAGDLRRAKNSIND